MEIEIAGNKYQVLKNEKEGLDKEVLNERFDDYFKPYDIIVGDWAYGKLRLKGFNKKGHPNFNKINDEGLIDNYLKINCAYGCKYFIIEKIK